MITHRDILIEELNSLLLKVKYKNFLDLKKLKILEIGAGFYSMENLFKQVFNEKEIEYICIDSYIQYQNEKTIKMDAHELKFESEFDIVFLSHTAEHFINPFLAFSEILRVLKKDSCVISITPSCCEHQIVYGDKDHIFVLNHLQWMRVFNNVGFKGIISYVQQTFENKAIQKEQDYNIFSIGWKE